MGNLINYYGMGNTAKGSVDFYQSIFQGLNTIYGLKGGTSSFKTQLLKKISNNYSKLYKVDVINSSIDINKIEGIIINELKLAIVLAKMEIEGFPLNKEALNVINEKYKSKNKCYSTGL